MPPCPVPLLLAAAVLLTATSVAASERLSVAVSLLPEAFLLDRVAAGGIETLVLVGPGDNEATYSPSPAKLAALDNAGLWFTIDVPFEDAWKPRILRDRPELKVVNLADGLPRRPIENHGGHDHAGAPDPHVWTDPRLMARMALRVGEALGEEDPAGAEGYRRRARDLHDELLSLHRELEQLLAPVAGGTFIVFHPSWGYFADAYNLRQLPIETGGHEPGPRALADLVNTGRAAGARAVFVQPQFSRRSARAVAQALGADIVEADPLARDYIDNLRQVARRVAAALAPAEATE